jgi:hypothetical protein
MLHIDADDVMPGEKFLDLGDRDGMDLALRSVSLVPIEPGDHIQHTRSNTRMYIQTPSLFLQPTAANR